jgi:hypothetical protein
MTSNIRKNHEGGAECPSSCLTAQNFSSATGKPFGRFNLQNLLSLLSLWRVECPHLSVNAGGFHDAPPSHHSYPRPPCGADHLADRLLALIQDYCYHHAGVNRDVLLGALQRVEDAVWEAKTP